MKVRTEWRFTPKAFGADDPGLQPQTGLRRAVAGFVPAKAGVEPGELRETDGGGGGESAAKGLKLGGSALFSIR